MFFPLLFVQWKQVKSSGKYKTVHLKPNIWIGLFHGRETQLTIHPAQSTDVLLRQFGHRQLIVPGIVGHVAIVGAEFRVL